MPNRGFIWGSTPPSLNLKCLRLHHNHSIIHPQVPENAPEAVYMSLKGENFLEHFILREAPKNKPEMLYV